MECNEDDGAAAIAAFRRDSGNTRSSAEQRSPQAEFERQREMIRCNN
jgi:hypothetical protein